MGQGVDSLAVGWLACRSPGIRCMQEDIATKYGATEPQSPQNKA